MLRIDDEVVDQYADLEELELSEEINQSTIDSQAKSCTSQSLELAKIAFFYISDLIKATHLKNNLFQLRNQTFMKVQLCATISGISKALTNQKTIYERKFNYYLPT